MILAGFSSGVPHIFSAGSLLSLVNIVGFLWRFLVCLACVFLVFDGALRNHSFGRIFEVFWPLDREEA